MLILIEGADGVGKTTFAKALRDELGRCELRHKSQIKRHPLEEYELDLATYVPGTGNHVVADRWHWGEIIYGPLYRGMTELDQPMFDHIERFLWSRGGLMVFIDGYEDEVAERIFGRGRGESFLRREDLGYVLDRYREISRMSIMPKVNTTNPKPRLILDLAEWSERAAAKLTKFTTYVGPTRPGYLLLGERRNNQHYPSAFVPYIATSGHYLGRALEESRLRTRVGFANACEEDVRELWMQLDRPKTCALGHAAYEVCQEAGIPHTSTPHPQYWRRFHHADLLGYRTKLEEACLETVG